jgi:hypothetical protein
MTSKTFSTAVLPFSLLLLMITRLAFPYTAGATEEQGGQTNSTAGPGHQSDTRGTWSGALFSKHSNVPPSTITVVITPNSKGHLIGNSSLNSDCLKGADLEVTVTGSTVVLAGHDAEGDSMTLRGTLDSTGTILTSSYILNGSATGKCETDDGTGTLTKR